MTQNYVNQLPKIMEPYPKSPKTPFCILLMAVSQCLLLHKLIFTYCSMEVLRQNVVIQSPLMGFRDLGKKKATCYLLDHTSQSPVSLSSYGSSSHQCLWANFIWKISLKSAMALLWWRSCAVYIITRVIKTRDLLNFSCLWDWGEIWDIVHWHQRGSGEGSLPMLAIAM